MVVQHCINNIRCCCCCRENCIPNLKLMLLSSRSTVGMMG